MLKHNVTKLSLISDQRVMLHTELCKMFVTL